MNILINNEATNPGNIGSYKNTPYERSIEPTIHYKPVKGSHIEWHKDKDLLRENINLSDVLKEWGISIEDLIDIVYSQILQNDKWSNIINYVEGDNISSEDVIPHMNMVKQFIRNDIISEAIQYLFNHRDQNPAELSYIFNDYKMRSKINDYNNSLKSPVSESMSYVREGILDDMYDLFTSDSNISRNSGTSVMNNLLKPHTLDDLYSGVIYRLRTSSTDSVVKNNIIPEFFPEEGKKSTLPQTISSQLIRVYKNKLENAIADFVSKDAVDIIKLTQQELKQKSPDYDISKISGDMYMGTILKNVDNARFGLIKKLKSIYKQFTEESQKDEWKVADNGGYKSNEYDTSIDKTINNAVKSIYKRYNSYDTKAVSQAVADIIQSDVFRSILDTSLKNTPQNRR